jgi:hypothetical protein
MESDGTPHHPACDCSQHRIAEEAAVHLRMARRCLDHLALGSSDGVHGPNFLQIEDAARAVHTALIALDERNAAGSLARAS